MKRFICIILILISSAHADSGKLTKVGVLSVLSGDLAVLGKNIVQTVETYRDHKLRHKIEFVFEDSRLNSQDGLKAYQKLINIDKVDLIIAGCSSNGTMAAKALINSSKTPTITVVTGGTGIDNSGPFIFRIGNSDRLNGIQEAQYFLNNKITRVALLTEETEYTQDISKAFKDYFEKNNGSLVYEQNFLPGASDFRSEITSIKSRSPQAILMPTQTGTALGIFVKQWKELHGQDIDIHTSFVAAPNPDAHTIAGDAINGVKYIAPSYAGEQKGWSEFLKLYNQDHNQDPAIPFHTAGTVDTLDLLQSYLDRNRTFEQESFRQYLQTMANGYQGFMGVYNFDQNGNTDFGFKLAEIKGVSIQ